MMGQVADRIDQIETATIGGPAEWRPKEVALNDVSVLERCENATGGCNRIAQIERDHRASPVLRGEVCVTPGATAGVENELVAEKVGLNRIDPVEELGFELRVLSVVMRPLPAEGVCSLLFEGGKVGRHEARDAFTDEPAVAGTATQLCVFDLPGACGTCERKRCT